MCLSEISVAFYLYKREYLLHYVVSRSDLLVKSNDVDSQFLTFLYVLDDSKTGEWMTHPASSTRWQPL